ncbi:MAG: oligoendopeptidase F [Chloroflexota bacterium]
MPAEQGLIRKDAAPESIWSGKKIFPTWADWEKEFDEAKEEIKVIGLFSGKLMASPQHVIDLMELYEQLNIKVGRLMMFARFAATVDSGDAEAKSAVGQAMSMIAEFSALGAYVEPEMLAEPEKLVEWGNTVPELQRYAHYFENLIRQKAHQRSTEVEEILSMLGDPFGAVNQTFTDLVNIDLNFEDAVDAAGKKYPIKQSTLSNSTQSSDRERRRSGWQNYYDGYLSMQNTLAANYIAFIKQQVFLARVRGYDSVLEMRLAPFNVPLEMFNTLIATFTKNLPTWHRYWDIKRRALGQDELKPYDIWAPIGTNSPKVAYHQAVDWICEAMQPLGNEYVSVMRAGCLEERWVDWAPNLEKRQGAASWRRYAMPPWIFMSYNESVFSMSTLSHELGHSMHTYLASENQPEVYFGFGALSSTITETASNFNQAMTRNYLRELKDGDDDFMLGMVEEALSNFHRYFFIMPTLARFELEVFTRAEQGSPLTVKTLNEIMLEKFSEGYGKTLSDDQQRTSITWATFLHLYMPFYTFQYAIGISAAHAAADQVRAEGPDAAKNYLEFLKSGGSMYTMDLFKLAGVDMASPEPVEKAFEELKANVDMLEKLIK